MSSRDARLNVSCVIWENVAIGTKYMRKCGKDMESTQSLSDDATAVWRKYKQSWKRNVQMYIDKKQQKSSNKTHSM